METRPLVTPFWDRMFWLGSFNYTERQLYSLLIIMNFFMRKNLFFKNYVIMFIIRSKIYIRLNDIKWYSTITSIGAMMDCDESHTPTPTQCVYFRMNF